MYIYIYTLYPVHCFPQKKPWVFSIASRPKALLAANPSLHHAEGLGALCAVLCAVLPREEAAFLAGQRRVAQGVFRAAGDGKNHGKTMGIAEKPWENLILLGFLENVLGNDVVDPGFCFKCFWGI